MAAKVSSLYDQQVYPLIATGLNFRLLSATLHSIFTCYNPQVVRLLVVRPHVVSPHVVSLHVV